MVEYNKTVEHTTNSRALLHQNLDDTVVSYVHVDPKKNTAYTFHASFFRYRNGINKDDIERAWVRAAAKAYSEIIDLQAVSEDDTVMLDKEIVTVLLQNKILEQFDIVHNSFDNLDTVVFEYILAIIDIGGFDRFYITDNGNALDCWVITDDVDYKTELRFVEKSIEFSDAGNKEFRCITLGKNVVNDAGLPSNTIVFQRKDGCK